MYKVTISIDDLHPEKNWGVLGDPSMEYLEILNKEFGAKFNLFIPSNYHSQFKLSDNKDWIEWLTSKSYFELCAHGHYHACQTQNIGEQEFLELDYLNAKNRLKLLFDEWNKVNYIPRGFRMPGWGCNQKSADAVSEVFDYIAAHEDINRYINFNTKNIFGCDGIHTTDELNIQKNGIIMFQSHIYGDWNKNVWNEENFNNIYQILKYMKDSFKDNPVTFHTIGELL